MEQLYSAVDFSLFIMHTRVKLLWFFLVGKKKRKEVPTRFFPVTALGWAVTNLLFDFIMILLAPTPWICKVILYDFSRHVYLNFDEQ